MKLDAGEARSSASPLSSSGSAIRPSGTVIKDKQAIATLPDRKKRTEDGCARRGSGA